MMRLDVPQNGESFGGNTLSAAEQTGGDRGADLMVVLICLAILAGMGFILWKVSPNGFGLFHVSPTTKAMDSAIPATPNLARMLNVTLAEAASMQARDTASTPTPEDAGKPLVVRRTSPVIVRPSGPGAHVTNDALTFVRQPRTTSQKRPATSRSGSVTITPTAPPAIRIESASAAAPVKTISTRSEHRPNFGSPPRTKRSRRAQEQEAAQG